MSFFVSFNAFLNEFGGGDTIQSVAEGKRGNQFKENEGAKKISYEEVSLKLNDELFGG
jgi:hypothetical protein